MLYLCNAGPGESYDDGHYIDSKLKLQELRDAVIHISPPHDSLHNAGEVIIGQDDVRGFFSYISACYTLETARETERVRDLGNACIKVSFIGEKWLLFLGFYSPVLLYTLIGGT